MGVLIFDDPAHLWAHAEMDDAHAHNAISLDEYMHMQHQTCGVAPHHHRYEGCRLVEKASIEIACDKHNITINKDTATVTWTAPEPVLVSINGRRSGPYSGSIQVTASVAGLYMVEIDDPKYCSNSVVINAEEPLDE